MVRRSIGALGYVQLAYAEENRLPFASIKNRSGKYVKASVESVLVALDDSAAKLQTEINAPVVDSAIANAYPIVGLSYLLLLQTPTNRAKGRALQDFLLWTMQPKAQKQAKDLFYFPLPNSILKLNERILAQIRL